MEPRSNLTEDDYKELSHRIYDGPVAKLNALISANNDTTKTAISMLYEHTERKGNLLDIFTAVMQYNEHIFNEIVEEYTLGHCDFCKYGYKVFNAGECPKYGPCAKNAADHIFEKAHIGKKLPDDNVLLHVVMITLDSMGYSYDLPIRDLNRLSEFLEFTIEPDDLYKCDISDFRMAEIVSTGDYIIRSNSSQQLLIPSLLEENCYMVNNKILIVLEEEPQTFMYMNGNTGEFRLTNSLGEDLTHTIDLNKKLEE